MFSFIGLFIGLFSYGFFGGVLGFIIGSFIDGWVFRRKIYRQRHHYSQSAFTNILLILAAEVMKADDQLKTSELDYIKRYLRSNFQPDTAQELLLSFRDVLDQHYDIDAVCADLRDHATIHEKLYVLQFLFGLSASDGTFVQSELLVIERISDLMGINRMDFESVKSMYVSWGQGSYSYSGSSNSTYYRPSVDSLENDYKILEIPSSATDEEVKKAYRTLAKKYHPDKVNHLGEEIRKDAEVKFTKLNQAYERIKKSRGMN